MWNSLTYVVVGILLLVTICFGILYFIAIKKRNKIDLIKKELETSYEELEDDYEVLENQGKELMNLYDKTKQSEDKLRKIAYIDTLTQLPNRDAISEEINSMLSTLTEEDQIALLYIDVDNLKEVNDTLGYTYGDELLIDITYRIKQVLNEDDMMGRISGDEFVVLTKNIEEMQDYEEKIKKILTVFKYPFSLAEKDCFVTVYIGIASLDKEIKNASTVIKNANAAMYKAKESGTVQYCYFDEEMKQSLMNQIQRQTDVRTALEQDEFFPVYQPVLDMDKHKVIGFEMLLRWDNPNEGVLVPADFLEAAIESGVIVPLGISFLKKALQVLDTWEKKGFSDLVIMINLSERQLLDTNMTGEIGKILKEIKIDKKRLIFDISELTYDNNEQVVAQRIKELKTLGVGVCLDDFGTVKGGLNYVMDNKFDFIKLDKRIVDDISLEEKKAVFLHDLAILLRNQDSAVVYEGVENPEQLEKIESFGAGLVQGFLFGAPLMEEEVVSYLETWMS